MIDWKKNRDNLLANIAELERLSPDTVKGYLTVTGAGGQTNKLDEKTRQLISLAVAVTTRCDGCLSVHSQKAAEAGASAEEVAEAVGVAVAMNTGAALVYSSRALDAFNSAKKP